MSKDIYIVYETTNLINGKYYIGVHKINGSDYLGSGKLLKLAIKKYGRNNFIRETLKEFNNESNAYKYEKLIIDNKLVKNQYCYNIVLGGGNPPTLKKHSKYTKNKIRLNSPKFWKGKHLSKETCIKLKEANSGKNSPRSKRWFINGKIFYSSREAGKHIGVSFMTIQYWCKINTPLCYRI